MKKNYFIIFLMFILITIPSIVVHAETGKLEPGDIEMECVYENGASISVYYSGEAYSMSASTFKLAGQISVPYSTSFTLFYNEGNWAKEIIQSATCPSKLYQTVIKQWNDEGGTVTYQLYYRADDKNKVMGGWDTTDESLFSSQVIAGFEPTGGDNVFFKVDKNSSIGNRGTVYLDGDDSQWCAFWFALKSEKIYLTGDAEPAYQWAFKSEGKQAASTPNYLTVSQYYSENGKKIQLVDKNKNITRLNKTWNFDELDLEKRTLFICIATSDKTITSTKNETAYTFNLARSSISKATHYRAKWAHAYRNPESFSAEEYKEVIGNTEIIKCDSGYTLYGGVDMSELDDKMDYGESICDVIPETALIISQWIQYAGYIVPVFLIIWTAVDIAKIVISGDIEEELPKKRKIIITRFIVAVMFFFLPIFVRLFISQNYDLNGVDLGDISCLYTDDNGEEE